MILSKLICRFQPINEKERHLFLAGPIRGTKDWQTEAYLHLRDKVFGTIASPRDLEIHMDRSLQPDPHWKVRSQTHWEARCIDLALASGFLMFWLPARNEDCGVHPFARDTRRELMLYLALNANNPKNIVIGYEKGFSGISPILDSIKLYNLQPSVLQECTLRQTCEHAAELFNATG